MMHIVTMPEPSLVYHQVAATIVRAVRSNPSGVLGLATGQTMIGVYKSLVNNYRAGDIDFSRVSTFNLDEYCGLAPGDPRSFQLYMWTHLFRHLNISSASWHLPPVFSRDAVVAAHTYDAAIVAAGGLDYQLLGIGHNGHIGFNEPGTPWELGTHIVVLSESTRHANAGAFGNDRRAVPYKAMTMGIRTIMQARHIVLAATGAEKAEVICRAVSGPVTRDLPASILQLHPCVTIIVDEVAGRDLSRLGFVAPWIQRRKTLAFIRNDSSSKVGRTG